MLENFYSFLFYDFLKVSCGYDFVNFDLVLELIYEMIVYLIC